MQAYCKFAYEIHPVGLVKTAAPTGAPPVIWTSDVINLIELLYACHELKLFNDGDVTLKRVVEHVCGLLGIDVKNASSYYARIRRRKADERTYFIDRLREVLLKRMEEDDEKHYRSR